MTKQKKKLKKGRVVKFLIILILITIGTFFILENNKNKRNVVTVISEITDYNYYLDNNETRVYKKYYKELEEQLASDKIDEEKYVVLIAKLFTIDFYTLDNKLNNLDVGGIQFVHSELQEKFSSLATGSIYKYVKSNTYNNRKQILPEVKEIGLIEVSNIRYNNKGFKDDIAYQVKLSINYVKKLDYPDEVKLTFIHEGMKLSLVEME